MTSVVTRSLAQALDLVAATALFLCALCTQAQHVTTGQTNRPSGTVKFCPARGVDADKIAALLETIGDHPTSGAYNTLGALYAQDKRTSCAVAAFESALHLDEDNWEAHYNLGVALISQGSRVRAQKELETATREKPESVSAHFALGNLFQLERKFPQAEAEFRAALANDPHFAPATAGLAQVLAAEEDLAAGAQLPESRKREVADLTEKANQNLKSGDAKAAAENYRKAVRLSPNDAKLRYNLALVLGQLKDVPGERRELQKAVELQPNFAAAENQLGLLALNSNQSADAERHLKRALEIDPHFAEAQNSLGVLYSQQGKAEEAASLFQQAIANDAHFAKPHVNLGLLMAQNGRFPDAEQHFRAALEIDASFTQAYAALGMLEAKTGHGVDAVKNFQRAVELKPNSAQAHLNLGIALVDQFDRNAALREFAEAARLDPGSASAHYNLGRFYFETGKYEDAHRELQTALRLNPQFPDTYYFLALAAKQNNDLEGSTEALKKLVALQPENADAQYLLGQNLEHAGDSQGAILHWKLAVQADPNHSQALFNLSKALNKAQDPEAQKYQTRFEELKNNQQITDRVSELGNFALEAANAQDWPQAFQQMNQAIQLCGNCAQSAHLHKNLGFFYQRTGNLAGAEQELRIALRLTPGDSDAENALAALEHVQDHAN